MSDHCKSCGNKHFSEEYNVGDSTKCYHCGADYVEIELHDSCTACNCKFDAIKHPNECPNCKEQFDNSLPNDCLDSNPYDYETCGECGFDHSYEPCEAATAHNRMDQTIVMSRADLLHYLRLSQIAAIDIREGT